MSRDTKPAQTPHDALKLLYEAEDRLTAVIHGGEGGMLPGSVVESVRECRVSLIQAIAHHKDVIDFAEQYHASGFVKS